MGARLAVYAIEPRTWMSLMTYLGSLCRIDQIQGCAEDHHVQDIVEQTFEEEGSAERDPPRMRRRMVSRTH